jgi:flagellin
MTIGVNANRSALNALQTLARGNDPAAVAQARSDTAKASAERAVNVQTPRADAVSLAAVKRSLDRAVSVSDVALSAGQTVSELIDQFRDAAREAAAEAEGPGRQDLSARLGAALRQVEHTVRKASFDGINLLDGSLDDDLQFSLGAAGERLTLSPRDLRPGGPFVTLGTAGEGAPDLLAQAEASSVNVSSAMADLRIQGRRIEAHTGFVSRLGEALVADQVDAELSKEGARLLALRVQQELAGERLSIANQAPQTVLQLFRS